MTGCVANNCVNRSESKVSLYSFPLQKKKRLGQWLKNINRKKWLPNTSSRICARHFTEDCFTINRNLKPDAIPTLFGNPGSPSKERAALINVNREHNYCKVFLDVEGVVDEADKAQVNVSKATEVSVIVDEAVKVQVNDSEATTSHHADNYYAMRKSPISFKRQAENKMGSIRKKLRLVQQKSRKKKSRKFKIKVSCLTQVIASLKEKLLISSGCAEMLENSFSGVHKTLLSRRVQSKRLKVSEELRSFAMTLHFYSAKAYSFVRKAFDLVLPHPATIRTWYSHISADPGFTKPAFSALACHAQNRMVEGKETLCALMLDEVAIRKHVEHAAGRFHGYVDLGCGTVDDSLPPAKGALVLMVVAINDSWKIPVAYFLIDGMTGEERANIISECLHRLHATGVRTVSLTCDGPSCHFSMLRALGATLDVNNMRSSFAHPADPSQMVHVLLDVNHMLKLLRNTLADEGLLQTPNGEIRWKYIEELNKLQEMFKMAHVRWEKQKMKVKLAAQVFSSSVADALEYCNTQLHLPQFSGCEETVKFLRTIYAAFDVLNSRNPLGKGFKAPMRISNKDRVQEILLKAQRSLLELKDSKGRLVHLGPRKTCVVGFIASCASAWNIFLEVVIQPNAPCSYLLTYRLSQDHLELFFSCLRACGGFNNNPTSRQFTAAYKRLLFSQVKTRTGNCILRDNTTIMDVTLSAANTLRRFDLKPVEQCDLEYQHCTNVDSMSDYKDAAINYIADFVVQKLKEKHTCMPCADALTSATVHPFILLKNRGGLSKPSAGVVAVCRESERCFQGILRTTSGKLPQCNVITSAIVTQVLEYSAGKTLFPQLHNHMFETTVDDNHVHILVKMASSLYCKLRMNHLAKRATESLNKDSVGHKFKKLIRFHHQ
uniref:THAP-type domain-containing protein n=1 Tax=Gadus morhua TaxID=8049 RepID=A0A8C5BZB7_GADMO